MKKRIIILICVAVVVFAGIAFFVGKRGPKATYSITTAKIEKGSISNTITATGTLEAITTVQLGTQVSGEIEKIYVDFNSQVKKGQLLATLDETPLKAQVDQSQATVDNSEAELDYQKATYERTKALYEKKLIAQSDYDLAEYNYRKAISNLNNAKSALERNKINLAYARIYSPIDGIILNRAVDEGQTVAASFNTPELFTIANDLTQMKVEANVDEADIGQVLTNQRVEFKVDAYPDQTFQGTVSQVRLQPVTSSNVVTYTVIINAPNPDKKLMPGMTANISIYVSEKKDILIVPGKSVRFSPDQQLIVAYMQSLEKSGKITPPENGNPEMGMGEGMPGKGSMPGGIPSPGGFQPNGKEGTTVWVKEGEMIHPRKIELGETDGINYELISGLNENDEVVTSLEKQTVKQAKAATASSPFMPARPGGPRK
ncbi:MAG TPA: efflux RND transporter periplasmic adaptor subunit [Prolixibacteraceae bacterium]|nr:efflux RND transporter periplasmic adaptor subunit [Prolixibacteraceae bacterium]HPS11833.1 efflux RND transporter periplasmic adaptor subunit [Prolixibacteraceae bacterium]